MEENLNYSDAEIAEGIPRRTIVKGVAWSIPIVATTVALPAASASVGCVEGGTITVTPPNRTEDDAGIQTWTVPVGVSKVSFTVIGGNGGSYRAMDGVPVATPGPTTPPTAERGSLVTGELMVTPGQVLTLIAGQGGAMSHGHAAVGNISESHSGGTGGHGYGKGGDAVWQRGVTASSMRFGGAGGGGSAILLGETPLVVAGGAGGAGGAFARTNQAAILDDMDGTGGGGDLAGEDLKWGYPTGEAWYDYAPGASGAIGGSPGAAGAAPRPCC